MRPAIVYVRDPRALIRFARLATDRGGGAVVQRLYARGQLRCRLTVQPAP